MGGTLDSAYTALTPTTEEQKFTTASGPCGWPVSLIIWTKFVLVCSLWCWLRALVPLLSAVGANHRPRGAENVVCLTRNLPPGGYIWNRKQSVSAVSFHVVVHLPVHSHSTDNVACLTMPGTVRGAVSLVQDEAKSHSHGPSILGRNEHQAMRWSWILFSKPFSSWEAQWLYVPTSSTPKCIHSTGV